MCISYLVWQRVLSEVGKITLVTCNFVLFPALNYFENMHRLKKVGARKMWNIFLRHGVHCLLKACGGEQR